LKPLTEIGAAAKPVYGGGEQVFYTLPVEILIFGGSFDPPHLGHAALLKAAIRRARPDKTYVFPSHRSPLKAGPRASGPERLAMAKLAFAGLPVRVDDFELRQAK